MALDTGKDTRRPHDPSSGVRHVSSNPRPAGQNEPHRFTGSRPSQTGSSYGTGLHHDTGYTRSNLGNHSNYSNPVHNSGMDRSRLHQSELNRDTGDSRSSRLGYNRENGISPNSAFGYSSGQTHTSTRRTSKLDDTSVVQINGAGESQSNNEFERRRRQNKKKAIRTRIIVMAIVELLTLVLIISGGMVYRYMRMTQDVAFDVSKVKNTNIDVSAQQKMKGYWTVAVFGVDSRDGGVGKGANADVQLIANVNMETGDIKLVSVYRDTYLNLKNGSRYAKSNEAYAAGGPEQAVSMLNSNLDLDIQNYVTFNWKAVADTVQMLGGTEIDISDKEFYYMNAYIHETCVKSGIDSKNPAAHYIKKAGLQHLDGVQTVAYARLRYMDNDFERTKRQREVIAQCLQKAKQCDLSTLTAIIDKVLPQVAFNIDTADIIQLAKGISRYNITGSEGFPKTLYTRMMGKKGDCVIPNTLKSNVIDLHQFLFNDMDYAPSKAVLGYSAKIMDDYAQAGSAKAETSAVSKETDKDKKKDVDYEDVTETDKDGKTITVKKKKTQETDADGYLIKGTDEDGNNIYVKDADGNKVKASSKNTKETKEAEVLETDADGNPIDSKKKKNNADGDPEETDTDDNGSTGIIHPFERETDANGNYVEETTKSKKNSKDNAKETTKESSKNTTKETAKSSEVEEPGASETKKHQNTKNQGGPGDSSSNSGSTKNSNSSNEELISEGPGSEPEAFTPGGPFGGPQ